MEKEFVPPSEEEVIERTRQLRADQDTAEFMFGLRKEQLEDAKGKWEEARRARMEAAFHQGMTAEEYLRLADEATAAFREMKERESMYRNAKEHLRSVYAEGEESRMREP
jgi:hypothetical protein